VIRQLRQRLTIEMPAPQPDGHGGQGDPWRTPTTLARVWGRVEPLRGRERLHGMQLEAGVTHRVTIRYRDDVTARHRLRLRARVFNIRAVIDPEERHRFLELLCEEGVAT
jgi:SPP1 family predicted phage head-tail adaptor